MRMWLILAAMALLLLLVLARTFGAESASAATKAARRHGRRHNTNSDGFTPEQQRQLDEHWREIEEQKRMAPELKRLQLASTGFDGVAAGFFHTALKGNEHPEHPEHVRQQAQLAAPQQISPHRFHVRP